MVPLPRSQHICNCKYTCQRVLCLLTWRHQQRVASYCFGKLWHWGEFTLPISSVHRSFGEHLGRPKIAHGSHNDVRHLCWPNLGCESPVAETPKGSLCWENLCGWGRLVGGTNWGDCGRKVSTQRKYACVFAGARGKCAGKMCGESAKELHLHSVAY